ncbi:DUF3889 domain-containing protein [Lentibacillus cibarius]|uniref:DUF3889 domain-containing protein n=1 Tax=Lentibacillus cibarius TaxID=2583219 RepID=A0A549YKV4_9BACI|nr:DUF3889 domain-containing protein [Lentibacillus cibarius]TRM12510.1 DUF3889 domain-containing protein [Lentibacillus cibarius]
MYRQNHYYPSAANFAPYQYDFPANANMNNVNPQFSEHSRQQTINGQATWTEGGAITKCGIPWSTNQYMTVAVGTNSSYPCGRMLKVRNPATGREILVKVVDETPGYAQNQINLHRKAFEALGVNPQQGIMNVEITPVHDFTQQKWGKYLMDIAKTAYPLYRIDESNFIDKTQISPEQTRETYEYVLQSSQDRFTVQGAVLYNPKNDWVLSFAMSEK